MANPKSEIQLRDYLDYSKWLFVGWVLGLVVGWLLDRSFLFGNPALEGLSRFIVGYGDTIGASIGILVGRLRSKRRSHAETFWWGTVIGTLIGPLLHFILIRKGFNSTELFAGALIAVAYSNADNWGGVLSSFFKAKRGQSALQALKDLYKDKFVVANVIALLLMLIAAVLVRLGGFAPSSYFAAALEGAVLDNDSTLAVLIFLFWVKLAVAARGH